MTNTDISIAIPCELTPAGHDLLFPPSQYVLKLKDGREIVMTGRESVRQEVSESADYHLSLHMQHSFDIRYPDGRVEHYHYPNVSWLDGERRLWREPGYEILRGEGDEQR